MDKITNDNYKSIIEDNDFVIIKFYADWCGPCKSYAPIYENVSKNYTYIRFTECNIEESKRVAVKYGIRTIPNTVIVKNKEKIADQFGALTEAQLIEFINNNIKK